MTYEFLQHYWCFIAALLGAILVSLLFVQGVNAVVHSLCYTEKGQQTIYNSIGSKWMLTDIALIAFLVVFFVAFPGFCSACFHGAYWLWSIFLLTFVLQAISYTFQDKVKHLGVFRVFLTINGYIGPMLFGCIVGTFFEGGDFIVEKSATASAPAIIHWSNASHGLDALADPLILVFSVAIFFLTRLLGVLYLLRKVTDEEIRSNCYGRLIAAIIHFVVLFLIFFGYLMKKDGYSYDDGGMISLTPYKYRTNFLHMWYLSVTLVIGICLVIYGALRTIINKTYKGGFWPAGIGTILTLLALTLGAMWNNTSYYPSTETLQSSLTIANSCSSESTLRVMFYGSLLVPFILAYLIYRWRTTGYGKLATEEPKDEHAH